jgi:hypothetical protein
MKRYLPKENECKGTDARLYDLIDYVYEYADRKKLTRGPFREYYELEDEWERYPENWEGMVLSMRAAVAVFGDRKKAAAFVRSFKNELTDAELSLVRKWRSHPWFYAAFNVVDDPGEHFVEAERIGDASSTWPNGEMPERFLIYSPRISDEYRHGRKTFITLLWEGEWEGGREGDLKEDRDGSGTGEPIFHTYGVIIPFQSVDGNDIRSFADVFHTKNRPSSSFPLKGISERGSAVSDAIMADPLSFLRLIKVSSSPRMRGPAGELYFCASVLKVSDIDSLADEDEWKSAAASVGEELYDFIEGRDEADESNRAAVYFGEGHLLEDPRIYISFDTSHVFLSSYSEEAYRRGRDAAKSLCAFPEQPQVRVSMSIVAMAHEVFEYEDELTKLQRYFEEEPGEHGNEYGDEAAPTLDELNEITRRIMDNYNEGVEEDEESIAKAVGVDVSKVTPIRDALISKLESMGNVGGEAADRFGLSPKAFHRLTNEEIPNVEGVLRMRSPEEMNTAAEEEGYDPSQLLSASRAYRFTRWFAGKVLDEGPLPATKSGYVQTKYIREALEKRILPSPEDILRELHLFSNHTSIDILREELRPKKEMDWMEFRNLRALTETAQIVVFDGKRFLPGHETDELVASPVKLYHHLLKAMCTGFEWDTLPHMGPVPFLRQMAPFLLYAIRRLSQVISSEEDTTPHESSEEGGANAEGWFHSDLLLEPFIAAAPTLAAEIRKEEKSFEENGRVFSLREAVKSGFETQFIRNFAERMGLVEVQIGEDYVNDMYLRPTPLFSIVFE